ncbi:NUDIX domain-containing protein [Parachitinimonas caeni]|uniref:NUDIX hydrolase n=1 Tax=Parachitinimonas caeni TaxID=3031301 RepID=A0ABT7DRQ7_9NEIS|nr:NUDIX hydrolase [Parachitinimonas caeni]MDK2122749.1 NUDIX hydrolase [Parachitinimonas caeni]
MRYHFCPCCAAALADTDLDGQTRQTCSQQCGYVNWNNPVPVVAALVLLRGEVILVRQANWPAGWFGLVTGYLEKAEEPRNGAAREVAEELGLRAVRVERIGEYPFVEQNQLILAYAIECEGDIVLSDELSEYKRVPINKLQAWPFGTGRAVADWLRQQETRTAVA